MKKKYGKVLVLMGGWSNEREISLISGKYVLESLISSGVFNGSSKTGPLPLTISQFIPIACGITNMSENIIIASSFGYRSKGCNVI